MVVCKSKIYCKGLNLGFLELKYLTLLDEIDRSVIFDIKLIFPGLKNDDLDSPSLYFLMSLANFIKVNKNTIEHL